MSLQDLQLPPLVISELYADVLVGIDAPGSTPIPAMGQTAAKSAPPKQTGTIPSYNEAAPDRTKPEPAQPQPIIPHAPARPEAVIPNEPPKPEPLPVEPVPQAAATPQARIKFLGGNKKHIAFIVDCKTDVFLPEAQLDWLGKMLEACRLNLGDVAIANIAKTGFTIADIKNELRSSTVILLGTGPMSIRLPLNFPHFNLQSHDGIVFLSTPSPHELTQPTNDAKLLKSKLWVCLQKLFKL